MDEWEAAWLKKIFDVIQKFDNNLSTLRQTATTEKKNQKKQAKISQNRISFEEATKANEEWIWLEVLQWYAQQASRGTLQSSIENVL